ncbi:MAG: glycosyltransferase [Patescibacteria group bacterium]
MRVDFCLPAKNEALILKDNLGKLLAYCQQADFNFSWRIVGVINGSSDSSAAIFKELKERFPDQVDYAVIQESGRGHALKRYWGSSPADILAYMDADLAVSLADIPGLIQPLIDNTSDLTIGSRLSAGAAVERSWYRDIISYSYNFLSRLLLDHHFLDLQCGFKAIRRPAFQSIHPFLQDDYWFFDTELIILAARLGYRVQEVPVDWHENRYRRRATTVKLLRDSLSFLNNLWHFRRRLARLKECFESAGDRPSESRHRLK